MSGPDPYKPAKPRKINEVPEALHGPREGAYSMNKGESDLSGQSRIHAKKWLTEKGTP